MKTKMLCSIVLLTALVCASAANAVGPLGPPMAGLKQGQSAVAIEYGYSRSDIEISDAGINETIDNIKSNAFIVQPGLGVTDDLETYALLGFADAKFKGFDDNYDFTYGFGTKLTFMKQTNVSWGAIFEMDWRSIEDSGADIDYYEMTIVVGPTIHITDTFRIYGGPFYYILNGDIDVDDTGVSPTGGEDEGPPPYEDEFIYESVRGASVKGMSLADLGDLGDGSFDLEEDSGFGGYIGAELDLNPNTSWYNEFQLAGNSWFFGTGINWKF
ncbi:MAG: hypothetical protein JW749_10260 [Sedimentisphaerales bacterium]|nr:hypothetical protein [Sedimentisphaerales bacterium]